MKPMKLVLASTAAAVLAAFNPAFAGGESEYNKDSSASGANVGSSSSMDSSASGSSEEKLTGLDRADQAASASSSGSGTALGDSTAGAEPGRDAALESDRRLN